jgi:MraZ protein
MARFKGRSTNYVDGKGRLAIPAKMRRVLTPDAQETFTATRGIEDCIYLYPLDVWERKEEAEFDPLNQYADDETRHFLRTIMMWAEDITLDKQGRVVLPAELRDLAAIDETAVVIGVGDHLEVWDPDRLDKYFAEQNSSYKTAAQQVMGGRPA